MPPLLLVNMFYPDDYDRAGVYWVLTHGRFNHVATEDSFFDHPAHFQLVGLLA